MALNDSKINAESIRAADAYPGLANPTKAAGADPLDANFMKDPTTTEIGAGAGPGFDGPAQAQRFFNDTAGVVEGRPGVIETSSIEPLAKNSNLDDEWARTNSKLSTGASGTGSGIIANTANVVSGVAQMVYGHAAGDEDAKKAGKEAVFDSK